MRKLALILVMAAFAGIALTAQNSRYETINGKQGKCETSFPDNVKMKVNPDLEQERQNFVRQDGKVERPNRNNQQENLLVSMNQLLENPRKKEANSVKVNIEIKKSDRDDVATVILKVLSHDGYQLLLDQDHVWYENFWNGIYNANVEAMYNDCEFTIPEDAGPDLFNPSVISHDAGSVDIPEGIYDFAVIIPREGNIYLPIWAETFDPANGIYDRPIINDYLFLAGYEYVLLVERESMVEFVVEYDASLTQIFLPQSSADLTDSEEIKIKLANRGIHDFSNVSLSYSINNRTYVTEIYTDVLEAGNEVIYTFDAKADFSEGGLYYVEAWVDYDLDMSYWRNKISGFTKKIAPLPLPFIDNFDNKLSMELWTVVSVNNNPWTWFYSTDLEDADGGVGELGVSTPWVWDNPNYANDYLISDPIIFPEAGTYNLSFFSYCIAVLYEEVESLKILIGTTPNYEEMEELASFSLAHYGWEINYLNFDVETPGNYYIAFYYYTHPQELYGSLHIDKVRISEGEFTYGPDIMISKILAPLPACEITNGTIGAIVFNNGTEPISEFTLTYQVNEDEPVTETFYFPIEVRESLTVYFNASYTFPGVGEHRLVITAETPGELEDLTANNVKEDIVKVVSPITQLPFSRNFASTPDREDWNPADPDGWRVGNAIGYNYYWAVKEFVPLVSRCVTLEPDSYRFTYDFSTGYDYFGDILRDNFYVTFGKSGTNPFTWQPIKEYYNSFSDGRVTDDITINITEAGEYVFAFFPVYINGTIRVFSASLDIAPEQDFRINSFNIPLSFPRLTPEYHIDGQKTFSAVIENRGRTEIENGAMEILLNGNIVSYENFSFSNPGEIINLILDANFGKLPTGLATLTVNTSIESGLSKTIEYLRVVSDSTFAWDNIDSHFDIGIGMNGVPCSFGLIYELQKADVLTSITLGLNERDPEDYPSDENFGLAVYKLNDNLEIIEMLFEIEHTRTVGNNLEAITFSVPAIELQQGKYFFELRQLDEYNVSIAFDETPDGYFYDNSDGFLSKIYGFGYIHLRPNFGNENVGINKSEIAQFVIYPNPTSGELKIENAKLKIENITVYNTAGQVVYTKSNINSNFYRLNTEFLNKGMYFISIQTKSGIENYKFVVN